jgi:hypothetical protein
MVVAVRQNSRQQVRLPTLDEPPGATARYMRRPLPCAAREGGRPKRAVARARHILRFAAHHSSLLVPRFPRRI